MSDLVNVPPETKKSPSDMSKEELIELLGVLSKENDDLTKENTALLAQKLKKKSDYDYFSSLFFLVSQGKRSFFHVRPAYRYKLDIKCLSDPKSIEYCIVHWVNNGVELSNCWTRFKECMLREELPGYSNAVDASASLIMLCHCFGIARNKYGYSKPRTLLRKTLYEFMLDVLYEGLDEDVPNSSMIMQRFEKADAAFLVIASNHVYSKATVISLAETIFLMLPNMIQLINYRMEMNKAEEEEITE